jgi:hypothetical protein
MKEKATEPGPRISVRQLAEYMVAKAARRRKIILDAKDPAPFIVNKYEYAKDALGDFLVDDPTNVEALLSEIVELKQRKAHSPNDESCLKLSIEALERFARHLESVELTSAFKREKGPLSAPKLSISKVKVSVQPNIIVRGTYKSKRALGAIKLVFGKTAPLTDDEGASIALLVLRYLEASKMDGEVVTPALCLVVDVFTGKVFTPPKATKRIYNHIEAACEEINVRWNSPVR